MRTIALWREVKEMGSCEAPPGGDAAEWCPVEMLRSAAQWRCCEELLALLDEGTVA